LEGSALPSVEIKLTKNKFSATEIFDQVARQAGFAEAGDCTVDGAFPAKLMRAKQLAGMQRCARNSTQTADYNGLRFER
jgi:hypothetical protein